MSLQSLDNTNWKFNSEITTTVKATLPEGSSFKVKINGIIYDGFGISCKYYSQIYMGLKKDDSAMNFAYVKTTDMLYKGYELSSGEGWYDTTSEGHPKIEGDVYLYIDTAVLGSGTQENLDNFIAQLEANATQIIEPSSDNKISFGNLNIKSMSLGSLPIKAMYFGNTKIYNEGSEPEPTLISFTIAGDEYQAEDGMTWEDWMDSEYNTDGFTNEGGSAVMNDSFTKAVAYNDTRVSKSDTIIEDGVYTLKRYGG